MPNNGLKPLHIFLISLLASLLLLGLWYTFSYQNKQNQMTELKSEIEVAEGTAAQYRQAQAALPQLREEVATLKKEREQFVTALPQNTQMARILTDMRRTAEETGIEVIGINTGGGGQQALPGGVTAVPLTLTMSGTYDQSYRTLQRLETLNRFTTIDNLQLQQPGEATSQDPDLAGTLGVTVYTFDPAQAAAPTEGGAPAAEGDAPAAPAPEAPAAPEAPTEGGQ